MRSNTFLALALTALVSVTALPIAKPQLGFLDDLSEEPEKLIEDIASELGLSLPTQLPSISTPSISLPTAEASVSIPSLSLPTSLLPSISLPAGLGSAMPTNDVSANLNSSGAAMDIGAETKRNYEGARLE